MRRLMVAAAITLFTASGTFAADETWTGKISDSKCGLSHKAAIEHGGGKMTNAQCTAACVKGGATYVFTSGGIVYALANQSDKDLALHAGKAVTLTGEKQGTTITVSKVVKRPKKRA
jgi:hypothetical protein